MKDHTEAILACDPEPQAVSMPRFGCFDFTHESNQPGYQPLTNVCGNCGEPIMQWRRHPNASYAHTATGFFWCDEKFWTKPQAWPKEAQNGNQ
jgi:hypothetical protein